MHIFLAIAANHFFHNKILLKKNYLLFHFSVHCDCSSVYQNLEKICQFNIPTCHFVFTTRCDECVERGGQLAPFRCIRGKRTERHSFGLRFFGVCTYHEVLLFQIPNKHIKITTGFQLQQKISTFILIELLT